MELAAGLADLPEMHVPGLLADDCTPEALAVLLGQSHGRIGLFSAEGGPSEIMNGAIPKRETTSSCFSRRIRAIRTRSIESGGSRSRSIILWWPSP